MEAVTVEILNQKAYKLLEDLADLDIIRLREPVSSTRNTLSVERKFGFAKDMIRRIGDDFNDPLDAFSEYMP